MNIRCKKSGRFLFSIKIEEYVEIFDKLGIEQNIPLKITIPCPRCKEKEEYDIYKTHYIKK